MRDHNLHWEIEISQAGELVEPPIFVNASSPLVWQDQDISWADFISRLHNIPEKLWCDLHLCGRLDRTQAITAGIDISQTITAVFVSLLPLYEACINKP